MDQMPLGLSLPASASFDNFEVGRNAEIVDVLRRRAEAQAIYLWGDEGTGRTHLLQAVCREDGRRGRGIFYLPLREAVARLAPAVLEGIAGLDRICLDDIDAVAGRRDWEEAVFRLYNECRERRSQLVVTSRLAPVESAVDLPDLRSRLSWGLVYRVWALDEAGRARVMKRRAAERGLVLGDEVVAYIMQRWRRDLGALLELLDWLDEASLIAQRPLTIPFVRDCIERIETRGRG